MEETRSSEFIKYLQAYLILLEDDAAMFQNQMDAFQGDLDSDEYKELELADIVNTGEMAATQHILSVATDIMNSSNERYE